MPAQEHDDPVVLHPGPCLQFSVGEIELVSGPGDGRRDEITFVGRAGKYLPFPVNQEHGCSVAAERGNPYLTIPFPAGYGDSSGNNRFFSGVSCIGDVMVTQLVVFKSPGRQVGLHPFASVGRAEQERTAQRIVTAPDVHQDILTPPQRMG